MLEAPGLWLWWVNLLTLKGQWGFSPLPTAFGNLICRLSSSLCGRLASVGMPLFQADTLLYLGFPLHSAFIDTPSFSLLLNQLALNMLGQNWQPIQAKDKGHGQKTFLFFVFENMAFLLTIRKVFNQFIGVWHFSVFRALPLQEAFMSNLLDLQTHNLPLNVARVNVFLSNGHGSFFQNFKSIAGGVKSRVLYSHAQVFF